MGRPKRGELSLALCSWRARVFWSSSGASNVQHATSKHRNIDTNYPTNNTTTATSPPSTTRRPRQLVIERSRERATAIEPAHNPKIIQFQPGVPEQCMAAMAVEGADQAPRLPMPSRNPLPLSASQEAQVRDIFYARVRSQCGPEIKGVCSQNLARQSARYLQYIS